jgi:hypothetical protein
VTPHTGHASTVFALSFKLRETVGDQGGVETSYSEKVAPQQKSASACWPSPQNGQLQPCPEFATQELNTGHTHFLIAEDV